MDEPAKFEKVDSFFELVKDANNDENWIDETKFSDENPIDVTLETEVGNEISGRKIAIRANEEYSRK